MTREWEKMAYVRIFLLVKFYLFGDILETSTHRSQWVKETPVWLPLTRFVERWIFRVMALDEKHVLGIYGNDGWFQRVISTQVSVKLYNDIITF